ncbi:MAG: DUF6807 family protein [Prolixibacteraceae bacterium]
MLKRILILPVVLFSLTVSAQINMVVKEGGFLFLEGSDSIFFYQKSPKNLEGKYNRCNYLHPLYGPDGTRLTEDFPADHLHHRGIFWAWHQILINNKQVSDGWELTDFEQKVTNFEYRLQQGNGLIIADVDWKSPLWKDGAEPYIREQTKIKIHPRTGNYRRLDFEIKLKALTDRIKIGGSDDEKAYGGFSVRMKLPEDVVFSSQNGAVEPTNLALEAGNYMKISGSVLKNGKEGGILIYNFPSNPGSSTSWIIRNKASMQNAAFPGRQPVSIPFDQPLILNYSILVYQGDLNEKQIKKAIK